MDKPNINALTNRIKNVVPKTFSAVNQPETKPTNTQNIAQAAASVAQKPKTAFQRITAKPDPEPKWYKGEQPTSSEILGRIYTIGSQDKERGRQLYSQWEAETKNPASPIYNPYTASTSRAAAELQALGLDTNDKNFFENNAWLKNHYRFGTGNSPLAPSSTSTKEQNAAYWYNKYAEDEATTRQAEAEWAALQEEIAYWAGRTDRNYSDAEILSKIDMGNYKTLARMDEAKAEGIPLSLTRSVGYSQDALNGVIWGARNGDNGDPAINSVRYALGQGKMYHQDDTISARLNPKSDLYNPYAVGSTIDDAALYFGASYFDQKWLDENKAMRGSNDETERKNYAKVYAAEETTQKAEAELERLWAFIDEQLTVTSDAEEVIANAKDYLEGDYWNDEAALSTLLKMDESLKTGSLMATTRSIDYKWEEVENAIRHRCDEMNAKPEAEETVRNFMVTYSEPIGPQQQNVVENTAMPSPVNTPQPDTNAITPSPTPAPVVYESDAAIKATKNNNVNAAGAIIAKHGTPEEKVAFAMGFDADSPAIIGTLSQFIHTSPIAAEKASAELVKRADAYTVQNYPSVQKNIADYQKLNSRLPEVESYEAKIAENKRLLSESEGQHELAGRYSNYSPAQKEAAYDYIFTLGYNNIEELTALLNAFNGNEEEVNAFRREVSNAFASGEVDGYTIDSWFEDAAVRLSDEERMQLADEIAKLSEEVASFHREQEELRPGYEAALKEKQKIEKSYKLAENVTGVTETGDGYFRNVMDVMDFLYDAGTAYQHEWKAYSDAQQLSSQGMEAKAVRAVGESRIQQNNEAIEYIDHAIETANANGIVAPELIANAEREKERLLRDNMDWEYEALRGNEDFASVVEKQRKEILEHNAKHKTGPESLRFTDLDGAMAGEEMSGTIAADHTTQEEKDTYLFILATEGEEEAQKYFNHISENLEVRISEANKEAIREMAEEAPILTTGLSVLLSPLQLAGTAYSIHQLVTGNEINPYSGWYSMNDFSNITKSVSKEKITETFGEGTFLSDAFNVLYDAAVSAGESVVNANLLGSVGGKFSNQLIGSFAGSVPMGLTAAGSTMQAVAERGGTSDQIALMGLTTFLSETLTEAVTYNNIVNAKTMGSAGAFKEGLGEIAKDMFLEEGVGEALSEGISALSDELIMGELSNYNTMVESYMREGMSRPEAEKQATKNIVNDIFMAYVTGALSSGVSGGLSYMSGRITKGKNKPSDSVEATGEETATPTAETATEATETAPKQGEEGYVDRFDRPAEEAAPQQGEEGYVDRFDRPSAEQEESAEAEYLAEERAAIQEESAERAVNAAMNSILALQNSVGADEASQVVAMAAALTPENADGAKMRAITAAAQHIGQRFGAENAVGVMSDVMAAWHGNLDDIQVAFVVAGNSNGESARLLNGFAANPDFIGEESVARFVEYARADMQNANVMAEVDKAVTDSAVANKEKAIIAAGALAGLRSQQDGLRQSKRNLLNAKAALAKMVTRYNSAKQNLKSVHEQFIQDPTNQQLSGLVDHAIKELDGYRKMVEEYTQARDNAQAAYDNAQKAFDTQQDAEMTKVREQAQQEYAAELAAEEQAKLDESSDKVYNDREVNENAVQRGGFDQVQELDNGQLSGPSGRDDGRGNNLYAQPGTGEGTTGRGTESRSQYLRQDMGRVPARLLSTEANENLRKNGVTDQPLFVVNDMQRFSYALDEAKASNDHGAYVDSQSVEDLQEKGAKLIMSEDGLSGAAVGTKGNEKGNIFGVFKSKQSKAKKASAQLMIQAVANGGTKLDCFDGGLRRMYSSVGFVPVARVAFNEEYAPPGWNFERDGKPDVVFWVHNGDDADVVAQKYGKTVENGGYHIYTPEEIASLPLFDDVTNENGETEYGYDRAWEYRDSLLQKRKGSNMQYMKGKRTQSTDVSSQNGKPKKSPNAISKELVKQLGIGDYIGTRKMNNLPQSVLGYYQTKTKYIAVRSKEAGDYVTTMHEIGHAIADKIGMTGTPQMVANLDPVFAASYKASELPGEAFAEFMWKYMISEQEARDFAGDAYVDAFERALVKNKLDKIVHKNADLLRAWVNANANDKIGATIKDRSSVRTVSIRDQFRKFFAGSLDATIAAERVMKKIREQTDSVVDFDSDIRSNALMKNTASKRAFNILTKNLTNAKWEVVGDSLADVFEKAGVKAKDMQLLERYMLALHSLDRDAQGKPVFDEHITEEERIAFIEQVKNEHPEIVEAEKGFQKWRTQFLTEFLVKTGKISQDELDAFNKMYPHYVPTQRVKSNRNAASQHKGAKKFQIRSATGSTEDIWSPIDTFVTMVDSIVKDVSANNAALAWANAYDKYEGMGVFGRRITPDVKKVEVDTTALQAQVKEKLEGSIEDDALQDILDMIGEKQSQFKVMAGKSNTPNTLSVQMPDGRIELFEMQDVELYKLLASVNDNASNLVFDVLGKLVKGMAMLTTGSNPVFAVRNFMRDFQSSVNYGSWASNYVTGFAKWMRAAWDVLRENGDFQKYQALGGGGWTRIDAGTKKGAAQYRSELFKGYNTSNVGRTAKFLVKKLWNTITFARLNEVVEQTSRYAEFKYGKNDTSTAEGAQKAFIAAQDVTVDFSRSGNGNFGYVMKQLVPFFGASSQGVYRTARMVTEAERSRLPARFAKTVVNTGLMSVLASGLLLKFLDDDEKKEYELLSDEMKAQYFYLPNFAPEIFGQQPLIRIPLAQDPLTYAVHGAFTNAVWSGNSDGPVIELEAIANAIIDGLNPLGSGTVFQPLIGAFASNKNWFGGDIVPPNLSSLPEYAQYTEETPDLFVTLGRLTNISPLKIQYLAEQYTGFLGQLAIPALSKDEFTGELGGLPAVISAVQKKFTSDPLVSNDVISSFYDGFDEIKGIKDVAEDGKPVEYLRRGLTEAEATSAYTEAKELVSADGILGQTKKAISDMYKEIDKINANDTLSDEEKYVLTSDVRRKMIEQTLVAQETIGEYREKYITGTNLITRITPGPVVHIPDAYESLSDVFKADEDKDYMQKARQVWEATENDSALPHPNEGFEYTPKGSPKQTYVVKGTEHWETWNEKYREAYETYVKRIKGFDNLTDDQKLEELKKAHSKAHEFAKEWYKKDVLQIKK